MADDNAEKNTTGEIDPSKWDEAVAVTGRPNDVASPNSTFAERAKKPDAEKVSQPAKTSSRKLKG